MALMPNDNTTRRCLAPPSRHRMRSRSASMVAIWSDVLFPSGKAEPSSTLRPPTWTFRLSPPHRHQLLCRLFEFLRPYVDGLAFVNRLNFADPFALRGTS